MKPHIPPEAAPWVFPYHLTFSLNIQARIFPDPDRIEVHIAGQFKEIVVGIDKDRLVTALKKMSNSFMAAIKIDRIRCVEPLHESAEVCLTGHHNQVEVIIHKDIGVNLHFVQIGCGFKNVQEAMPVGVIFENRFSFVSPACHMIPCPGYSIGRGRAMVGGIMKTQISQQLRFDPIFLCGEVFPLTEGLLMGDPLFRFIEAGRFADGRLCVSTKKRYG